MIKLLDILENVNLDVISNIKSFKDMPSNLKLISSRGTTRNVYEYDDNYVLKIAKNNKGIEQNKKEIENLIKYDSSLFPKLKKYDKENYRYLVVEKVNDFKTGKDFYKNMFPEFENIYSKFREFYNEYHQTYNIPDYSKSTKFNLYTNQIIPAYLKDKPIYFISKTEFDKLYIQNKNLFSTDREKFYSLAPKEKTINFLTSEEINNILDKNINAKNIKKLYKSGYPSQDLHWKNFGYINNQLKIIDLGL
jgi:hypothetical protein